MTQKGVIKELSKRTGYTQKSIEEVIDVLEEYLKEVVSSVDTKIKVLDLSFTSKELKARTFKNPSTGTIQELPPKIKLKITPSADWIKRLN